jgi:hypothetical protein
MAKKRTLFKNAQWAVIPTGLYCEKMDYFIEKSRLGSTAACNPDRITFYSWPIHLSEKTWVDIPLFIEAWNHACSYHEIARDPALVDLTVQEVTKNTTMSKQAPIVEVDDGTTLSQAFELIFEDAVTTVNAWSLVARRIRHLLLDDTVFVPAGRAKTVVFGDFRDPADRRLQVIITPAYKHDERRLRVRVSARLTAEDLPAQHALFTYHFSRIKDKTLTLKFSQRAMTHQCRFK